MTFRQLLSEIIRLKEIRSVAEHVIGFTTNWQSMNVDKLEQAYIRISEELIDLPGSEELTDHQILIRDEGAHDGENIVSVLLEDSKDDWAIDFVDWNDLIDLEIKDEVCTTLSERLARVLHEITFWGHTRASVLQQAAESLRATNDTENLIEVTLEEFLDEAKS